MTPATFMVVVSVVLGASPGRATSAPQTPTFVVTPRVAELSVPIDTTGEWPLHRSPSGTVDYYFNISFPFLDETIWMGFIHGSDGRERASSFAQVLLSSDSRISRSDPVTHCILDRDSVEVVVLDGVLSVRTTDAEWIAWIIGSLQDSVTCSMRLRESRSQRIPIEYRIDVISEVTSRTAFEALQKRGEEDRRRLFPNRIAERSFVSICQDGRFLLIDNGGRPLGAREIEDIFGDRLAPALDSLDAQSFVLRDDEVYLANAALYCVDLKSGATTVLVPGSSSSDFTVAVYDVSISPTGRYLTVVQEGEEVILYDVNRKRGVRRFDGYSQVVWETDGSVVSAVGNSFELEPWRLRREGSSVVLGGRHYDLDRHTLLRQSAVNVDWESVTEFPFAWLRSDGWPAAIVGMIGERLYISSGPRVIVVNTRTKETALLIDAGPEFKRASVALQYFWNAR